MDATAFALELGIVAAYVASEVISTWLDNDDNDGDGEPIAVEEETET